MAIALVQTAALGSTGSGTSQQTSAFASNPTVGNYIVAWAWGWNPATGTTAPAISDTGGNSYTIPTGGFQERTGDLWSVVAWTKVATSGATFRLTVTKAATWSAGSLMIVASEFSGVAAASPLDGTPAGTNSTTGVPAPGSMAVASGSLVAPVMVRDSTTFLGSTPTGFNRVAFQNDGTNFEVGEAIYAINPSSPANPSWATSTTAWAASQFALLAASGGSAFLARRPLLVPQAVRRASSY